MIHKKESSLNFGWDNFYCKFKLVAMDLVIGSGGVLPSVLRRLGGNFEYSSSAG